MNAEETLNLIAKQWCTLEDIMKLGHLGRNSALKAKKKIKEKLEKQGYLIPKSVVPTKEVVVFFDIDIKMFNALTKNIKGDMEYKKNGRFSEKMYIFLDELINHSNKVK